MCSLFLPKGFLKRVDATRSLGFVNGMVVANEVQSLCPAPFPPWGSDTDLTRRLELIISSACDRSVMPVVLLFGEDPMGFVAYTLSRCIIPLDVRFVSGGPHEHAYSGRGHKLSFLPETPIKSMRQWFTSNATNYSHGINANIIFIPPNSTGVHEFSAFSRADRVTITERGQLQNSPPVSASIYSVEGHDSHVDNLLIKNDIPAIPLTQHVHIDVRKSYGSACPQHSGDYDATITVAPGPGCSFVCPGNPSELLNCTNGWAKVTEGSVKGCPGGGTLQYSVHGIGGTSEVAWLIAYADFISRFEIRGSRDKWELSICPTRREVKYPLPVPGPGGTLAWSPPPSIDNYPCRQPKESMVWGEGDVVIIHTRGMGAHGASKGELIAGGSDGTVCRSIWTKSDIRLSLRAVGSEHFLDAYKIKAYSRGTSIRVVFNPRVRNGLPSPPKYDSMWDTGPAQAVLQTMASQMCTKHPYKRDRKGNWKFSTSTHA